MTDINGSTVVARLIVSAFLLFFLPVAYSNQANAPSDFMVAKKAYFDSLTLTANSYADEIYENSTPETKKQFSRDALKVTVLSGADRRCYSAFTVGYILIGEQDKTIIICEEDVATAADYAVAQALIISASLQESWNEIKVRSGDKPFQNKLDSEIIGRLRALAEYYVRTNRDAKTLMYTKNRYGKSQCYAWDAAYRLRKGRASLDACYRQNLSTDESERAAQWAMQQVIFGLRMVSEDAGTPLEISDVKTSQPMLVMHKLRSAYLDRFLYYVVAHEFGHAVSNPSIEVLQSDMEGELSADRFAVTAIRRFQVRAFALPFLALTLDTLWTTAKTTDTGRNRTNSLSKAVFCDGKTQIRSQGMSKLEDYVFSNFETDLCKGR